MKIETTWDLIKLIYWKKFGIPPMVVDFIAVQDVLRKCVSGYGNRTICFATDEPINYVRDTLIYFLGFAGWDDDLDINPLAVYNACDNSFEKYKQDIVITSALLTDFQIELSFKVCERYKTILKEIKKYYV